MMMEKGSYWVALELNPEYGTSCAKENFCFKQNKNDKSSFPEKDTSGGRGNGHICMKFDCTDELHKWRYATEREITEYERRGRPFDVTKLEYENEELLLTTIL